jgi:hypothetical protein
MLLEKREAQILKLKLMLSLQCFYRDRGSCQDKRRKRKTVTYFHIFLEYVRHNCFKSSRNDFHEMRYTTV